MHDDLDPTTARLVSELAAVILPSLTKSLASAIPANDFSGAIELSNRNTQDLRNDTLKALRNISDDSRAGRSIIMQSVGNVLEEISALRKIIEPLPSQIINSIPDNKPAINPENIMNELDAISERIDTLTQGIKAFFEAYAEHSENISVNIPDTLRPSFDADAFKDIEGLIRAEGKTHSTQLAELSREISTLTEENNIALVHEVREVVAEELSGVVSGGEAEHSRSSSGHKKLVMIAAVLSGTAVVIGLVNTVILLLR